MEEVTRNGWFYIRPGRILDIGIGGKGVRWVATRDGIEGGQRRRKFPEDSSARSLLRDLGIVAGVACLIVWLAASERYFYPSSAGSDISPLLVFNASYVLLVIVCFTSYRRDSSRAFTFPWVAGMSVAGIASGSVVGTLVAHGSPPAAALYACAVLSGLSSAILTYAWVDRLVRRTGYEAFRICAIGLFGASLIDLACMSMSEGFISVSYGVLGAITVAALVADGLRDGQAGSSGPMVYRPRQMGDYLKMLVGIAVLAAALGIVAGALADNCTIESMRALNRLVGLGMLGVGAVVCAALLVRRGNLDWMAFLRVTPTALLVVTLLNIIVPQYSGVWNALTMVLWILVRILVVLFVAEVARIGVASLPLALPMALAVMMAGHCLGMYVATTGLDALIGFVGLDGVVALVGLLAAGSSMLVLSSRVVLGMMVGSQVSLGIAAVPGAAEGNAPASDGFRTWVRVWAEATKTNAEGRRASADATMGASEENPSMAQSSGGEPGAQRPMAEGSSIAEVASEGVPANAVAAMEAVAATRESARMVAGASDRDVEQGEISGRKVLSEADVLSGPTAPPNVGAVDGDPFVIACGEVAAFYKLSERESEVLALLARGNTRAHIADRLVISENTVRAHVKSIYAKLSIHSKQQLIELVDRRVNRIRMRIQA